MSIPLYIGHTSPDGRSVKPDVVYVSPQVPSTTVTPDEHKRLLDRAFGPYADFHTIVAVSQALGAAYSDINPDKPLSIEDAQMLSQLAQKLVERGVLIILP